MHGGGRGSAGTREDAAVRWSEGHERPLEDYIYGIMVMSILAGLSYLATGWPLVFPPEAWGFDRERMRR
jgi:hypothetical protein